MSIISCKTVANSHSSSNITTHDDGRQAHSYVLFDINNNPISCIALLIKDGDIKEIQI